MIPNTYCGYTFHTQSFLQKNKTHEDERSHGDQRPRFMTHDTSRYPSQWLRVLRRRPHDTAVHQEEGMHQAPVVKIASPATPLSRTHPTPYTHPPHTPHLIHTPTLSSWSLEDDPKSCWLLTGKKMEKIWGRRFFYLVCWAGGGFESHTHRLVQFCGSAKIEESKCGERVRKGENRGILKISWWILRGWEWDKK